MSSTKVSKKTKKASKLLYVEPKNIGAARRAVIQRIAKKDGAESVGVIRNKVFIKSSSLRFNWVAGGGWCRGRIYEVSGKYSSGKTTWTLDAIANAQQQFPDKFTAFQDIEETFDARWASKFGVDSKRLDIFRPPNAQAAFDELYELCNSGAYSLIVVDSLAAMVPIEELLTDVAGAKDKMGVFARVVSTGLKRLLYVAARSQTTIIIINQLRDTLAMYGPKTTTPGGNALKHLCSCRIQVSVVSGSEIKDDNDEILGQTMKLFLEKNKLGLPKRSTEIELIFNKPFDSITELRKLAYENEIITKKKGAYYYEGEKIAESKEDFKKALEQDSKLKWEIYEKVEKSMNVEETMDVERTREIEEIVKDAPDRASEEELFDFGGGKEPVAEGEDDEEFDEEEEDVEEEEGEEAEEEEDPNA